MNSEKINSFPQPIIKSSIIKPIHTASSQDRHGDHAGDHVVQSLVLPTKFTE